MFDLFFYRCLHVSLSTIRRRRDELGLDPSSVNRFSVISDNDLDGEVINVLQQTPNAGETLVLGSLSGRGIFKLSLHMYLIDGCFGVGKFSWLELEEPKVWKNFSGRWMCFQKFISRKK